MSGTGAEYKNPPPPTPRWEGCCCLWEGWANGIEKRKKASVECVTEEKNGKREKGGGGGGDTGSITSTTMDLYKPHRRPILFNLLFLLPPFFSESCVHWTWLCSYTSPFGIHTLPVLPSDPPIDPVVVVVLNSRALGEIHNPHWKETKTHNSSRDISISSILLRNFSFSSPLCCRRNFKNRMKERNKRWCGEIASSLAYCHQHNGIFFLDFFVVWAHPTSSIPYVLLLASSLQTPSLFVSFLSKQTTMSIEEGRTTTTMFYRILRASSGMLWIFHRLNITVAISKYLKQKMRSTNVISSCHIRWR